MQNRPYQNKAITDVRAKFLQGKTRVILCSPTGSGKTVMFSLFASLAIKKKPTQKILLCTDREELLQESTKTFRQFNLEVEFITAKTKQVDYTANVFVAMIESLEPRLKLLPKIDLIIIDECHVGNFRKVFEFFPNTRTIGVTATPIAAKKDEPLNKWFDDIVVAADTPELIEQGYLCRCETVSITTVNDKELKISGDDFSTSSLLKVFSKSEIYDNAFRLIEKFRDRGKKGIVFCANGTHTKITYEQFKAQGFNVRYVLANSKDREETFKWYKDTPDAVLINCGIATKGFNERPIQWVMNFFKTISLTKYLQICGRGSRTCDEIGKEMFRVYDLGGSCKDPAIGLWHEPRDWERIFREAKVPTKGAPPTKGCPTCERIIRISAQTCEYCGHSFARELPEMPKVEFGVIGSEQSKPKKKRNFKEMSFDELFEVHSSGEKSYYWIIAQLFLRENYTELIKKFQEKKGYKPAWVYQVHKLNNKEIQKT